MPRDPFQYLEDIVIAIESIQTFVKGMNLNEFISDKKTVDAVIRNLEVIGEASARLPEELKYTYQEIEWRKIIGMRNILIHEYFGIHLPIIWDVVTGKLDMLLNTCRCILEEKDKKSNE